LINDDPVVWCKAREGDDLGMYGLYRHGEIVGFSDDPKVDVCSAGDQTLYSCRDEDGRIKVRFDYNNPIGVHRDLAHLQFVHERALYAATDDGTNWYVRWGDYRGPLFDEIYSIQETESGIEYVARKRRRLYRVRASY
jgi:hypothetical protein